MSSKKLIGIALIPAEEIEIGVEELATVRIERNTQGEYFFPEEEKEVIDMLLKEILKEENATTKSMVFLAIDIAERRRRRRRRATSAESVGIRKRRVER